MKIGGFLKVKNEEQTVCQVLRHHLDVEGFDIIIVIDNGSSDNTLRKVQNFKDSRVQLVSTTADSGFQHHIYCTMAANQLFSDFKCDWVFPIDADEYWHSRRWGTVRRALRQISMIEKNIPASYFTLLTSEYRFEESSKDNAHEYNFICRLQHCRQTQQKKVVMYRLRDQLHTVDYGCHSVSLKVANQKKTLFEIDPFELARFHYPQINKKDLICRTLNKVEGYLISTRGKWLEGNSAHNNLGLHVWNYYQMIKQGKFDSYYYENQFLTEDKINQGHKDGSVLHNDALALIYKTTLDQTG